MCLQVSGLCLEVVRFIYFVSMRIFFSLFSSESMCVYTHIDIYVAFSYLLHKNLPCQLKLVRLIQLQYASNAYTRLYPSTLIPILPVHTSSSPHKSMYVFGADTNTVNDSKPKCCQQTASSIFTSTQCYNN